MVNILNSNTSDHGQAGIAAIKEASIREFTPAAVGTLAQYQHSTACFFIIWPQIWHWRSSGARCALEPAFDEIAGKTYPQSQCMALGGLINIHIGHLRAALT